MSLLKIIQSEIEDYSKLELDALRFIYLKFLTIKMQS
jgi:hypothetical protein